MSSSNLISIITIIVVLLTVEKSTICCLSKNNITFNCEPGERKALMRFKATFSDDPSNNRLSSWKNNTECCSWEGVECDHANRHVVRLDLRNRVVDEYIGDPSPDSNRLRSDTIDSSLLELKYLSYLDLSGNYFNDSSIPTFLGSMKQLQYLNLSYAFFAGIVPHQLGNLSSLRTLDLGGENGLIADDVTWAGNLSSLEYLDMNNVDLSTTKDIIKVLTMLPFLVDLRLSTTGLANTNLPHANCVNSTGLFTYVQHLDLSFNSLGENSSFCFLHNMTSLSFLDLSYNSLHQKANWISDLLLDKCELKSLNLQSNRFYGDISLAFRNLSGCLGNNLESLNLGDNEFGGHLHEDLGELKELRDLDVSGNKLSGPIPSSLGNLRVLTVLHLSDNQLNGEIPISFGQLSNLEWIDIIDNKLYGPIPSSLGNLTALTVLELSNNQLGGEIPFSLGQLLNLEWMDISDNNLSGPIPSSLGNLRALRSLYLSYNQLGGKIPVSLGQLSNLVYFVISNNSLEGTLSEAHFAKLSRLEYLYIGSNDGIKFGVGDDWVPPFHQLMSLEMGSVEIGSRFPKWLQTQKSLLELDLRNCSIRGTMPTWLGSLMNLIGLYLSNNHIEGPIQELLSNIQYLDLSRNLINGSIPESLCQMKGLEFLDLSRNHLSGHLPDCNWGNFHSLYVAVLSSNQLSGDIPNSIGGAYQLRWLQLSNNRFTGQIPNTIKNCTSLSFLDLGDNKLSGNLPHWIGNHLLDLRVLRIRNNEFRGVIPPTYCELSRLQIMDLAHNQLTGYIPNCFGNLWGMIKFGGFLNDDLRDLSFSEVVKGVLLEYTSSTTLYLVNLDLSSNRLFGEIPSELTDLIALNGLNLSHNHLTGTIPQRIGDVSSLESLDLSSNSVSGKIPQSLSKLAYLSHLNLSNNDLSGPIPTGPQLQTLSDLSRYNGNPGLCGDPLPKKCQNSNNETPLQPRKVENDDDGDTLLTDTIYLCAFISSGVATGFWGYFGVLILKRSWRRALFRRMDVLIAKMLGRY